MRLPKEGEKKWKVGKSNKQRENWTPDEHQRFLDALKLYERDWKKIEGFVQSKTVIQIRSHAQKYFLKMQKLGRTDCIPPPRSKRRNYRTDKPRTPIPAMNPPAPPSPANKPSAISTKADARAPKEQSLLSLSVDPAVPGHLENTVIITHPQQLMLQDDGFDHSVVYNYLARLLDPSSGGLLQDLAGMTPNNRRWCQLLMRNFAKNIEARVVTD